MKIAHRTRPPVLLLVLPLLTASAVFVGSVSTSAAVSRQPAPRDRWLQTNGDAGQNRTNLAQTFTLAEVSKLRVKWDAVGGGLGANDGGAVISAGRAYFASTHGSGWQIVEVINAVRLSDGHRLWATPVPKPAKEPTRSDNRFLAIRGKFLYVAEYVSNDSARVTAINTETHKVVWIGSASPAPEYFSNSDVRDFVVAGRQVYLESEYGIVDAFDRFTGRRLWHERITGGAGGLAASAGILVDADARRGGVVAFDGRTGHAIWSLPSAGGLMTIAAGRVIIASTSQRSAVPLRPCTSSSKCTIDSWRTDAPDLCRFDHNDGGNLVSLSAADAHNVVFAERCGDHAYLQNIDATTGVVKVDAQASALRHR